VDEAAERVQLRGLAEQEIPPSIVLGAVHVHDETSRCN
jgi:hypothetical protein